MSLLTMAVRMSVVKGCRQAVSTRSHCTRFDAPIIVEMWIYQVAVVF